MRQDSTKVTFEQRPEAGEGTSHEISGTKLVPGRRNSRCKEPEVGPCLECLRNSEEASEDAAKRDMR